MPTPKDLLEELERLENSILENMQRAIPEEEQDKSLFFIELIRTYDYWFLLNDLFPEDKRLSAWALHVMQCSWPRVVKSLYGSLKKLKGFPAAQWTPILKQYEMNYLHGAGYSAILDRFQEEYKAGLLDIVKNEQSEWHVNARPGTEIQFMDQYDLSYMNDFYYKPYEYKKSYFKKWAPHVEGSIDDLIKDFEYGALLRRDRIYKDAKALAGEFREAIFPYPVRWGNILGYNASDNICLTMFEQAYDQVRKWMHDAGVDSNCILFDDISALDLSIVVAQLVATHMIHSRFIFYAMEKKDFSIDIDFSITIWSISDDIINGTRFLYGIEPKKIQKILNIITLNDRTYDIVANGKNFDMPLLVDMGNGLYIRPISSLGKNPFGFIKRVLAKNEAKAYNLLIKHQEKMLRDDIYRFFGGNRFQCLDSNIKLKAPSGKILTDVDASIFDVITNTLAVFQLKWQDYRTTSVQELRSKAKNLSEETDKWAYNVEKWFKTVSSEQATRTFKIKSKSDYVIVLFFVVSREVSYIEGYGYYPKHPSIAIANYPYFSRLRTEIGPHANTFLLMHKAISEKRADISKIKAEPVSFELENHKFICDRYWFSMSNQHEKGDDGDLPSS